MKTKKNITITEEDGLAAESGKSKGISLGTRKKPKTLLEAIDNINTKLSNYVHENGNDEDIDLTKACGNNVDYLAKRLGVTPLQAVVFCICVELGPNCIDYNDFARALRISKAQALALVEVLNGLVRRRLLTLTSGFRDKTSSYVIPGRVIKALTTNTDYDVPHRKCEDTMGLLSYFHEFYDELEEEGIKQGLLLEEVNDLFQENPGLDIVDRIERYGLCPNNRLLLLFFCDKLVNEDDPYLNFFDLESLYPSKKEFALVKSQMRVGRNELMIKGLLEFTCNNGIADTSSFTLTAKARTELLASVNLTVKEEELSGVIHAESIAAKELYYTAKVGKQVDKLRAFLDQEKYKVLVERMRERYNRCGLTCLMYGGPGTGKTETVYQLARLTGRDVMAIEVPQIKSKWVGDSEKNIKAVFDKYRGIVAKAKVAPILLFNEADAIIGIRKSGAQNAVDKMENSIQNIILQEMETLNGIMIATTNLTENLDSAFERRFLYKVEFERPDADVREHIWHAMLPELDDSECKTLAEGFDFSGGQIENVARKFAIDGILGELEQADRLSELTTLCSEERINDPVMKSVTQRRRVGFVA